MTIAPLTGSLYIGKDGLHTRQNGYFDMPVDGFYIDADILQSRMVFMMAGFNVDKDLQAIPDYKASLPGDYATDGAARYLVPCQIIEREKLAV
jgi:hypothetical protein